MSESTNDLSVPLPAGRTVTEVADLVLELALAGASADEAEHRLAAGFGLSADDAFLARDRTFGGLVRAATQNPANRPDPELDPIAAHTFDRGLAHPSLIAHFFPEFGRPEPGPEGAFEAPTEASFPRRPPP